MNEKKILMLICVLAAIIIVIISLDCGVLTGSRQRETARIQLFGALARMVVTETSDFMILIDPGHGGMDGGAASSDGTLEKDINLAIAKQLAAEVEQYPCSVILTRERDEWLCDAEEGSIRSRKTADLKARREMIRKYEPDITVSIHLNSFREDPGVRGAQVFYPDSKGQAGSSLPVMDVDSGGQAGSSLPVMDVDSGGQAGSDVMQQCRQLAEVMQDVLNETLQPDEPRNAMTRDGVFLFREVVSPMIIVECGFMSNPEEAAKLGTDEYQKELAQCIMAGIAEFAGLGKTEEREIIDSR